MWITCKSIQLTPYFALGRNWNFAHTLYIFMRFVCNSVETISAKVCWTLLNFVKIGKVKAFLHLQAWINFWPYFSTLLSDLDNVWHKKCARNAVGVFWVSWISALGWPYVFCGCKLNYTMRVPWNTVTFESKELLGKNCVLCHGVHRLLSCYNCEMKQEEIATVTEINMYLFGTWALKCYLNGPRRLKIK